MLKIVKINILVYCIFLICFINLFGMQDLKDISNRNIDIYKKNFRELVNMSNSLIAEGNFVESLFVLRLAFAKAEMIRDRVQVLFKIAKLYEFQGDIKKAKLQYRRIIQNYSSEDEIVQAAKERLLKV